MAREEEKVLSTVLLIRVQSQCGRMEGMPAFGPGLVVIENPLLLSRLSKVLSLPRTMFKVIGCTLDYVVERLAFKTQAAASHGSPLCGGQRFRLFAAREQYRRLQALRTGRAHACAGSHRDVWLRQFQKLGHETGTVSLLTSHLGEPVSIPGRVTPGFSNVGIVLDDAAGRRVSSGIYRFPLPSIPALKTLILRVAQISSLHLLLSIDSEILYVTRSCPTFASLRIARLSALGSVPETVSPSGAELKAGGEGACTPMFLFNRSRRGTLHQVTDAAEQLRLPERPNFTHSASLTLHCTDTLSRRFPSRWSLLLPLISLRPSSIAETPATRPLNNSSLGGPTFLVIRFRDDVTALAITSTSSCGTKQRACCSHRPFLADRMAVVEQTHAVIFPGSWSDVERFRALPYSGLYRSQSGRKTLPCERARRQLVYTAAHCRRLRFTARGSVSQAREAALKGRRHEKRARLFNGAQARESKWASRRLGRPLWREAVVLFRRGEEIRRLAATSLRAHSWWHVANQIKRFSHSCRLLNNALSTQGFEIDVRLPHMTAYPQCVFLCAQIPVPQSGGAPPVCVAGGSVFESWSMISNPEIYKGVPHAACATAVVRLSGLVPPSVPERIECRGYRYKNFLVIALPLSARLVTSKATVWSAAEHCATLSARCAKIAKSQVATTVSSGSEVCGLRASARRRVRLTGGTIASGALLTDIWNDDKIWTALSIEVFRADEVTEMSMEQHWNERAGKREIPEKTHRLTAQFPHAKIRSDPAGD
ncbi:hypothetical protein PR048_006210 [Dryococelus australis]|uniref:Uncharacterized protein n=1 Tax=Dryococelus australis TaxID=614101 RepID=A0ABQ9IAA9_9NEOP|nr:hypothetical protein PR048_006210 [Dryococelus australis]